MSNVALRLKGKFHRGLAHKFRRSLRHKFRRSLYSACSSIVDSGILELNLIPSTYIESLSLSLSLSLVYFRSTFQTRRIPVAFASPETPAVCRSSKLLFHVAIIFFFFFFLLSFSLNERKETKRNEILRWHSRVVVDEVKTLTEIRIDRFDQLTSEYFPRRTERQNL